MAKQKSTFQFSGKIGTIVGMKGANGESYIREYVKPANPKSTKQTEQRVKMSLAGLMSKLTAQSIIYGMGTTPRKRRPAFVSNIVRKAVVTTSAGQQIAKIEPLEIMFSDGINQPIGYSGVPSLSRTTLTIPYEAATFTNNPDLASIVFVGIAMSTGNVANAVMSGVMVREGATDVVMRAPEDTAEVWVYYIPVFRADGVDNTSYMRDIEYLQGDTSIGAVVNIAERGSVEWRRSVYYQRAINQ